MFLLSQEKLLSRFFFKEKKCMRESWFKWKRTVALELRSFFFPPTKIYEWSSGPWLMLCVLRNWGRLVKNIVSGKDSEHRTLVRLRYPSVFNVIREAATRSSHREKQRELVRWLWKVVPDGATTVKSCANWYSHCEKQCCGFSQKQA